MIRFPQHKDRKYFQVEGTKKIKELHGNSISNTFQRKYENFN